MVSGERDRAFVSVGYATTSAKKPAFVGAGHARPAANKEQGE